MSRRTDVIIIGGGLSGLSAAKWLHQSDIAVLVLEARDRVGGRTLTKKSPDVGYVDLGGSYVGPTQDHLFRLTKELCIDNYKIEENEDVVYFSQGKRYLHKTTGSIPFRNPFVHLDINNFTRTIDEMGKEVPADEPWKAPHAEEWDTMTYQTFMDETCYTEQCRAVAKACIEEPLASSPYESSFLWMLWFTKLCQGMKSMMSVTNGGQERKFIGGSQQISERIAERLGNCVLLNSPVVEITQSEKEVTVKTLNGKTYDANYIIMAIPLPLQMKIHYNPPLSAHRNQLIQRCPMGSVMKCILYYQTEFWKKHGFCGTSLIDVDDENPISSTYNDTKPDGSYPAIVGFVLADQVRKVAHLTQEERKDIFRKCLCNVFGLEEFLKPIHYEEYNWMSEQFSGGCFTAMFPPGFLTRYGEFLRKPVGKMYFAGTETATTWTGYMEGAIEAGERAAREVMHDMGMLKKEEIWRKEPPTNGIELDPSRTTWLERNMPPIKTIVYFLKIILIQVLIIVVSLLLTNLI
ncbi:amine oxidase [flavin-containing] B-like [Centruroides sculpturatus]|uniref:amine oxidase [flavin-containing] B-like n=1 Tax=Centruroides sculpturatus TaxID=218467 RepID=UPI000C6D1CED|nr:amine oxidase [flavin-containing] B-like [Centruroides sculpturatus]